MRGGGVRGGCVSRAAPASSAPPARPGAGGPRTIWSLMTLPSSSTVRIFCGRGAEGRRGRGMGERDERGRVRARARGPRAAGLRERPHATPFLSLKKRTHKVDADGGDVGLRVGVILAEGKGRAEGSGERETRRGEARAPGEGGGREKKKENRRHPSPPSKQKKNAPQTAAAGRTCPRPSRRSAGAVQGGEGGGCEGVRGRRPRREAGGPRDSERCPLSFTRRRGRSLSLPHTRVPRTPPFKHGPCCPPWGVPPPPPCPPTLKR